MHPDDRKDKAIDLALTLLNRPTRSILMPEKTKVIEELWEARQTPLPNFITPPLNLDRADEAIRAGRIVSWDVGMSDWDYGESG